MYYILNSYNKLNYRKDFQKIIKKRNAFTVLYLLIPYVDVSCLQDYKNPSVSWFKVEQYVVLEISTTVAMAVMQRAISLKPLILGQWENRATLCIQIQIKLLSFFFFFLKYPDYLSKEEPGLVCHQRCQECFEFLLQEPIENIFNKKKTLEMKGRKKKGWLVLCVNLARPSARLFKSNTTLSISVKVFCRCD